MPSPLVHRRFRAAAIMAVLALGAVGLGGCDQREPQNPFIGPSGAAGEMPFGVLDAKPSGAPASASASIRASQGIGSTVPGTTRDG